ncbi:phosphoribosyltransferase [Candidatus Thorarchaeota archaeon]|nr:MAG: phosphoribosyltransferase [Candidatus Thorarchaeota archaeon]
MIEYEDRAEAGMHLLSELESMEFESKPLVLAIPNGGLPVASEIATGLGADLDVIIVRKLQIPGNPEAGFGALTSFGSVILNDILVRQMALNKSDIDAAVEKTESQIQRRRDAFGGLVGKHNPKNREVVLVDDGLASGYTMLAAIESVNREDPKRVIVAVPTSPGSAAGRVERAADALVCPRIETRHVFAVANAYVNWYDVPDKEAKEILQQFR